jgi:hypothetical protein
LLVRGSSSELKKHGLKAAGATFRLARERDGGKGWNSYVAGGLATVPELWDAAYEQAAAGTMDVEPDCESLWTMPVSRRQRGLFAGGPEADRGVVNLQSDEFPLGPGFAWHLEDNYSQLKSARGSIANPQPVRVAFLDVGFDFNHAAMPAKLDSELQRNFVDDGRDPHDASDPDTGGILRNPGHGTATIAILAGRALAGMKPPTPDGVVLGGSPEARIVPIRIATSVVLLRAGAFVDAIEYILELNKRPETAVDIVSMSMGGVASAAWADAVNRAYEAGILLVTAAGNNFGRPKSIVFPARFRRVLAACGIMANFEPYDLGFGKMSGNYGPDSKMDTAIAAFTPNIPWAEIGSKDIVDWDGQGTSSATPQVAAAAALWLAMHKQSVAGWEGWEKVEMIRKALSSSAERSHPEFRKYFGQGVLKARAALDVKPSAAARASLEPQKPDSALFALFRALRGTIFTAAGQEETPLDRMFELELAQLIHRDGEVEAAVADPERGASKRELERLRDAVIASPQASATLKRALEARSGRPGKKRKSAPATGGKSEYAQSAPGARRLRVFSFDPSAGRSLETLDINVTVVSIPYEPTKPGPSGEYVEVVDHDPASGCYYAPVNLEEAPVMASDGLTPAEGNPKFHQQMVYGVAMRTVQLFEAALGRKALWSPRMKGIDDSGYVPQLRIYPHALREHNAYYNPLKKALLFGYFPARPVDPGQLEPGGMVFTCLSHDVIAHETSHALLDGMARGLTEPTNPDMLAFHEAFADIVALFSHFSLPGVLDQQLARVRGDLRSRNLLGELAGEFGRGYGLHGALRSYIGRVNEKTGQWERLQPSASDYSNATEEHDRGAVLVAAIFDAFLSIYERRIEDLKRIASEGSGILRQGDLHPDLVRRFAQEARKAAGRMLKICIRAVDYCPPVDLTFGDFLRAAITADADLFPEDASDMRVALIEAFRERGIYPKDVRTMSEDALRWKGPESKADEPLRKGMARLRAIGDIIRRLSSSVGDVAWPPWEEKFLDLPNPERETGHALRLEMPPPGRMKPREAIFHLLRRERAVLKVLWSGAIASLPADERKTLGATLGIDLGGDGWPRFEVRALNFSDRSGEAGQARRDAIVWLQQSHKLEVNGEEAPFEGGCTLVIDLDRGAVRYAVRKSSTSESRRKATAEFRARGGAKGMTYFGGSPLAGPGHRFAMIHGSEAEEESYA